MNNYSVLIPINNEYSIKNIIRDTFYYTTFYAFNSAGEPRIVRVFKTDKLKLSELMFFKQEYETIMGLDVKGLIRILQIGLYQGNPAVVSEFYEPFFLSDFLDGGRVDLSTFFNLVIPFVKLLSELHKKNIMCLDVSPVNIVYEADSLRIIDFSSSVILTKKNEKLFEHDKIREYLPYISPEQTGRMNRAADYRSDLYSLGIIFYELLTGSTPFSSQDPMEIIHSHIARVPVPVNEVNDDVPHVLSRIVMKLIEKSPEERYQNAGGLLSDLVRCANQLTSGGSMEDFVIARNDVSPVFKIPGVLIGRTKEIRFFKNIFETTILRDIPGRDTGSGMGVILVYGNAGCGKSALTDEMRKIAAVNRISCLSGKYQEHLHNTPYSAVAEALTGMIRQILAGSEERITVWRDKIKGALGENGRVITDILPEVELLIGRQPAVPELGAEAVYKLVLQNLPCYVALV